MTQLYSFSLDIKLPKDGSPQIIEFNASDNSGFAGYEMIGLGDIFNQKIIPDLQKLFPNRPIRSVTQNESYRHYYEDPENENGIFLLKYYKPTRNKLLYARHRSQNNNQITANSDLMIHSLCDNKAAMADIMTDCDQSLHVPTFICPTEYHRDISTQIVDSLGKHEFYILKPADGLVGNGVRVIPHSKLEQTLYHNLKLIRSYAPFKNGHDYWISDKNPLCLVQPYIASKPTYHNSAYYDGTMRVFVSAYRENKNDDFQIICHDAYWKLPKTPQQKISHSPYHHEDFNFIKSVRSFFNKHALGTVIGAHVSNSDKAFVFQELEEKLPFMIHKMTEKSHRALISDYLFSKNSTESAIGVMLATHPDFYLSNDNYFSANYYPGSSFHPSVAKKLLKIAQKGPKFIATPLKKIAQEIHDDLASQVTCPPGFKDCYEMIYRHAPEQKNLFRRFFDI